MILDAYGEPVEPVAQVPALIAEKATSSVPFIGTGWYPLVRESFPGAWQKNVTIDRQGVLAFHTVFSCMTLIASDIAKLRVKLIQSGDANIWVETENPAYSPVLRKPNAYQTRIQFWECYVLSKLMTGNTYVLKERDERQVVIRLHVLDAKRVRPLISEAGEVFYEIQDDALAQVERQTVVPEREIIHDRFNCIFHPLVGMSPIFANGLAAMQGTSIQHASRWIFDNRAMIGGILTAPGNIDQTEADKLREQWQENYTGRNIGKIAVLGGGLKFEQAPVINPVDAQLIEQLKWTSETVCNTFHVPGYKVGVGTAPSYANVQALNLEYYEQCLQSHIEAAEECLNVGLGLIDKPKLGVEFDIDGLLRMDSISQVSTVGQAVGAGIMAPNEGRAKLDLPPVRGGESPYLQQQNYSLAALAKRDAQEDPFAPKTPPKPPAPDEGDDGDVSEEPDQGAPANENDRQFEEALDRFFAAE